MRERDRPGKFARRIYGERISVVVKRAEVSTEKRCWCCDGVPRGRSRHCFFNDGTGETTMILREFCRAQSTIMSRFNGNPTIYSWIVYRPCFFFTPLRACVCRSVTPAQILANRNRAQVFTNSPMVEWAEIVSTRSGLNPQNRTPPQRRRRLLLVSLSYRDIKKRSSSQWLKVFMFTHCYHPQQLFFPSPPP